MTATTYPDAGERRQMALTPKDIEAIVEAVIARQKAEMNHVCRFEGADPELMKNALGFYKSFNEAMTDTKKTIRRWVVLALLTGTAGLLGKGVWVYFKEAAKQATPK